MLKKIFNSLLLFALFFYCQQALSNPEVYLLYNSKFAGDTDQSEGAVRALSQKFKDQGMIPEVKRIDLKESPPLPTSTTEKTIFITAGSDGAEAFLKLKAEQVPGIYTHLSHQLLDLHPHLIEAGVDMVVLPEHVMTQAKASDIKSKVPASKTTLLEVTGVSHNFQEEDLLKAYDLAKSTIPEASRYLLFILGGDAQQSDGKTWSYYTPEEAKKAARMIIKQLQEDPELFLLVTNGPRTGKFNHRTGEETEAHKSPGLDPVTEAFLFTLKQEIPNKRFKLFNFQFGTESPFKALLGAAISHPQSLVYVPGESTSMISQVVDNLPKGHVIVYEHPAMNETHKAHVRSEFTKTRIKLLPQEGPLQTPLEVSSTPLESAAEKIGKHITELYLKR